MSQSVDFAPRLMRPSAAAHYLGVGVSTLAGLGLPTRKIGRAVVYDRRDLERFADDLTGGEAENPFGPAG
jgi:hypothetical protein